VLDLQLAVQNLEVWSDKLNRTVRLSDICFKPLSPDNNNCTIMSALNYFQNSHANIDYEQLDEYGFYVVADYLTHFSLCSR
jgi:Niemann-Pick C1 protein